MTEAMAERLAAAGTLAPDWRDAFLATPRRSFIPGTVWVDAGDDAGFVTVNRAEDPQEWEGLVEADAPVVTQIDDGNPGPDTVGSFPSSSASAPSMVMSMLGHLGVRDGDRVLEIGTGTGWNAALLAARLGDARVVTIDIDPGIVDTARSALAAARRFPVVVCGDGEAGYVDAAPYDRVIATCAVQRIPYPWVEQTRTGGVVLAPWRTAYDDAALVRLQVDGDGTAAGRFVGRVAFMLARGQRLAQADVDGRDPEQAESVTTTELPPAEVVNGRDGPFTIGLLVPGCKQVIQFAGQPGAFPYTLWLADPDTGSWAAITMEEHTEPPYRVHQHGPRALWDDVEAAYNWWAERGRPAYTRFGLTVTPDRQWTWLDTPERHVGAV